MAATLTTTKPPGLATRYISATAACSSTASSEYSTSKDVTISKVSAGKGDGRDRGAREARAAGLAADFEADGRQIEAVGAPESAEELKVVAGAAAAIEEQGARSGLRSPDGAAE